MNQIQTNEGGQTKIDTYLYGNLTTMDVEELKKVYKGLSAALYPEAYNRIEIELLSRKEITVRKDFVRDNKTIEYPTKKKEAKLFGIK